MAPTSETALLELLNNPLDLYMVTNVIASSVSDSFRRHPMRKITENEIKRRFEICVRWFRELKDAAFTNARTMNEIPLALDAELAGRAYEIPTTTLWSPHGGRI